jgi:hypothetical protein
MIRFNLSRFKPPFERTIRRLRLQTQHSDDTDRAAAVARSV